MFSIEGKGMVIMNFGSYIFNAIYWVVYCAATVLFIVFHSIFAGLAVPTVKAIFFATKDFFMIFVPMLMDDPSNIVPMLTDRHPSKIPSLMLGLTVMTTLAFYTLHFCLYYFGGRLLFSTIAGALFLYCHLNKKSAPKKAAMASAPEKANVAAAPKTAAVAQEAPKKAIVHKKAAVAAAAAAAPKRVVVAAPHNVVKAAAVKMTALEDATAEVDMICQDRHYHDPMELSEMINEWCDYLEKMAEQASSTKEQTKWMELIERMEDLEGNLNDSIYNYTRSNNDEEHNNATTYSNNSNSRTTTTSSKTKTTMTKKNKTKKEEPKRPRRSARLATAAATAAAAGL